MTPADIAVILRRLDDQDVDLDEIKTHVKQTNGRVLSLELWRAYILGALAVLSAIVLGIGVPVALAVLL